MRTIQSDVPGFEGECAVVWLNTNQVNNRFDGGITGFFRLVNKGWLGIRYRTGEEFHGIIKNGRVESSER